MEKILKRKKTLIILGACIAIFCVAFGTVSIAQNYYKSSSSDKKEKAVYQMAEKEKERLKDKGTYNPKDHIEKEDLAEKAENVADVFDMSVSEAEKRITENSVEKKALYLAAEDAGITVSEQDVTDEIEKIKAALATDPEGKKELEAEIAGMGMDEEEYWNFLRPQYKSNMIVNKYLNKMYEEKCKEEKIDLYSEECMEKRKEWRDSITQEAIKKYNVTVE